MVEGKPLKLAESLICQAWCKCFKHRTSFNVLRNSGKFEVLSSFYTWGNKELVVRHRMSGRIKLSDSKSHCSEPI